MALQAKVGSFLSGTSASGTVTAFISGLAFTPQVVLLFGGTLRTSDASGGGEGDAEMWHGAIDANGNQFCFANAMDDANAEAYSLCSDGNCVMFIDADDGSLDGALTFDSIATGTVNLRVTRQFTGNRVTFYLAIGGLPEGGDFKVGTFDAAPSGTQTVTGPGFQPQSLCLMASWESAFDTLDTERMSVSIGFVESDGSQGCSGIARSATNDSVMTALQTDACVNIQTGITANVRVATFAGFAPEGFTLNWAHGGGGANTMKVGYVALSGADFEVVEYTSPTNTSTTSVAVKATPVGMAGFSNYDSTQDADTRAFSAGFSDITDDRAHGFRSNGGETQEYYRVDAFVAYARTPGGTYDVRFTAEVDAWDADSADIDVLVNDDGTAFPALLFFLSEAVPPTPSVAGQNFRYIPVMAGMG